MGAGFPFNKYFGEINVLARLQFDPADKPYSDRAERDAEPKDLLLYLGCNVLRTGHLVRAIVDVLTAMGFDFNVAGGPAYCCGVIHFRNGAPEASRSYVGNSLRNFAAFEPKQVLMWCPSCNEHYDGVVTTQHDVPFPYEHVTAFVARHLDRVRFANRIDKRVALHYHTGHWQQDLDRQSTRTILSAIPGLEYVEVPNSPELGRHCSTTYIERAGRAAWQRHIDDVMRAAAAAGADVLATIYHSCQREICGEEAKYPFEIVNWVSLLAHAMGLPAHEDWFKRHRLAGDPAATFEEVRPRVEAAGLDPERVKEVLARSFAPKCETRLPSPS
jgi:Fe-S oxidoreductase